MFNYTHIVKSRIKHIYLRFDMSGKLIVTSPPCSTEHIEKVLLKKSQWIANAQKKIEQRIKYSRETPTAVRYLGIQYPLEIETSTTNKSLLFDPNKGFVMRGDYDPLAIDKFYLAKAKELLPAEISKWAQRMNLYPNKVNFRKTKRQWGSCSKDNNISLSTMLLKLPTHLIDYVIVHELAHIHFKHHQKSFWELVGNYVPEYKNYKQELKSYV